jgi:small-conductance mechanosensitive channel/CRP-like cAMP-binding protein
MHDAVASFALFAITIAALVATRRRGVLTQLLTEATLLVAISSFLAWHGTAPLPHDGSFPATVDGTWLRALAVVWWLIGARLVVSITVLARGRDPKSRDARLFSELIAAVIYITAILIVLNSVLNLPIGGLLATSGVIAIVLGLALQNTLADVFAGIAVGVEKPFHVGDRVSLGDHVEGVIVQMNWRSIRIQTDGEDLATIPNSIVAKGQIINRSVPTSRRIDTVEIVAPSEARAETLFELFRQAAMLCPIILDAPPPSVGLRRAGLRTSTYATTFYVIDTPTMFEARSMLLRQIRRLFRHAGIGLPAPMTSSELLASLVLFDALNADEIQALVSTLVTHAVEPGDVIFRQGTLGTSIYIVQSGILEIVREKDSVSKTLGRIGPGEYMGELGLITGMARAVTMTALTHGRVLELPGDSLTELIKSNASLNATMERCVKRGLAMLDRDSAALDSQPIAQGFDLLARIRDFFRSAR